MGDLKDTGHSMVYPQFYHIGLPKTGTTTIQHVLRSDDRLHVTGTRFFSRFAYWEKPFSHAKPGQINIASEENLVLQMEDFGKLHLLLSRIRRCAPNANIIVTIREQRSLLESRYKYNFPWHGGYHRNFEEWLRSAQGMDYLSVCMYSSLYDSIRAFFPANQIHFLMFEELKVNYAGFFKKFYGILNLAPPPELIASAVSKNESLTENELYILKKLNRFKMFRKDSTLARYELALFLKIASAFRNRERKRDDFRWIKNHAAAAIEKDFASENKGLAERDIFSIDKLVQFNYIVQ
jgi:hypothetical protein